MSRKFLCSYKFTSNNVNGVTSGGGSVIFVIPGRMNEACIARLEENLKQRHPEFDSVFIDGFSMLEEDDD